MDNSSMCVANSNVTPFLISVQDALLLDQSAEFQILRSHLRTDISKNNFCASHSHKEDSDDHAAWTVMRDILHALLAPIVALYDHSSSIAQDSVRSYRQEDLEYAFSGKARNAYVWLQSFLSTERDWCLSQDCPACIVSSALDGEAPLRLIMASCLLSSVKGTINMSRPTLPAFDFFIRSISRAMSDDRLWGQQQFEITELKAYALQDAMLELMYQCQSAETALLTPPSSPESIDTPIRTHRDSIGMPIKRSPLATRQAKMLREEAQYFKSIVSSANAGSAIAPDFASPITTEFVRRLSIFGREE